MYYEEKEENGVWYYRHDPRARWTKFNDRKYTNKISELKSENINKAQHTTLPLDELRAICKIRNRAMLDAMYSPEKTTKTKLEESDILSVIDDVNHHTFPDTNMTICAITLKNGYVVIGQNACVDKSNWSKKLAYNYSYKAAVEKIWELEGYLLKEKLYNERGAPGDE